MDNARDAASEHKTLVIRKAEEFQNSQADIDRRLLNITHSSESDEAIARFEESMEKLHSLDVATAYLERLREVDNLRYLTL